MFSFYILCLSVTDGHILTCLNILTDVFCVLLNNKNLIKLVQMLFSQKSVFSVFIPKISSGCLKQKNRSEIRLCLKTKSIDSEFDCDKN